MAVALWYASASGHVRDYVHGHANVNGPSMLY